MQQIIQQTVEGLGYELVEVEKIGQGTLRITIDWPWSGVEQASQEMWQPEQTITTDDCEKVTRQLQYVFEVENIDYKRLEISSPGLDRLLQNERDFWRFQNYTLDLVLKQPIAVQANGIVAGNRKKFRGVLQRGEQNWQLLWSAQEESQAPQKKTKKPVKSKVTAEEVVNVMEFNLNEIREARLVPVINFNSK